MNPSSSSARVIVDEAGIHLTGSLRRGGSPKLFETLSASLKNIEDSHISIDMSNVTEIDSLGASLLAELEAVGKVKGKSITFDSASSSVEVGMDKYNYPAPELRLPDVEPRKMESLGERAYEFWEGLGHLLILISESFYWSIYALWHPGGHRKGAVAAQALSIGVGAFPVIAVISFLIGAVMAMQSAEQLRQFGANIYVADLVVISMIREMGPLMTAILLAGRSGASIAAEIASMTVNEEIDALRTMALRPIRFVVVPKMLAITLTAPLLTILASLLGIFGGFIVAITTLDITPQAFLFEAQSVLYMKDLITGLVKSFVFAWLIVILAAYFGFRVKGGPEGVGKATTKAVVAAIFGVIVADSVLGLWFYL